MTRPVDARLLQARFGLVYGLQALRRLRGMARWRAGTPRIAVVYVYPIVGESRHDASARRFVSTYRECPPLHDHSLHVVYNGGAPSAENAAVFDGLEAVFHQHDDTGWDVGVFMMAARAIDCDMMVCLGGNSYFRRAGWLKQMAAAFGEHGAGLYGASASYDPTPHIRSTGFWCHPSVVRAYPAKVLAYQDRYDFEHGITSLTRLCETAGLGTWVVTWDGTHPKTEWRTPPDIYWRGDQSNSLVYDRLYDVYDSDPVAQPFYAAFADGWGDLQDWYGDGTIVSPRLREAVPGRSGGGPVEGPCGPWSLLAREVLETLKGSAGDEAAAARVEADFIDKLSFEEGLAWRSLILAEFELSESSSSPDATRAAICRALRLDGCRGSSDA